MMAMRAFSRSILPVLVVAGLVIGDVAQASADPTLNPTPEPQGPIAQSPDGSAGAPVQRVVPGDTPCFSCAPNDVTGSAPSGPGPTPTVVPVLNHTNSGAYHDPLTVDGVDFTPGKSVHVELDPDRPGDFAPFGTDRQADSSGAIHVKFGYQTASARDGGKGGVVIATDSATDTVTAPLAVLVFPPVTIDNG